MNTLAHAIETACPIAGLLWAYRWDPTHGAADLPPESTITFPAQGWLWLHVNLADVRAKTFLMSLPQLQAVARQFDVADPEPHITHSGTASYGTVSDLQRGVGETRETIGLLHFFASEQVLITARRSAVYAPGAVRQLLQTGRKFATVEDLLEGLLGQVVAGADLVCEKLSKEVDRVEDQITFGSISGVRPLLGRHRRAGILLHRHVNGQRILFQRLGRERFAPQAPASLIATARVLQQECEAIDREIISLVERTKSLQDEVSATLAEETNNNLRILSVLSILFLPPTFVTGLFGMNMQGMAFAEQRSGFWYATALAVGAAVLVAWILRRSGVLRKNPD